MQSTQEKQEQAALPSAPVLQLSKKKQKWIKPLFICTALLVLLAFLVLFYAPSSKQKAGDYLSSPVQIRDLTISVSSTGTVQPIDSFNVSGLVTGDVLEAPFQEGDWVEKDSLLYRIDPGSAATALQQAQLAVQQAQLNYNTLSDGLAPKARAAGIVQKVHIKVGDMVVPGSPIAEIYDTSTMTLELPFQSADALNIAVGDAALVVLSGTLETLPGLVEFVAPADQVGPGGSLVRQVKIQVENPGALTETTLATAMVGEAACASSGNFQAKLSQTVTSTGSGEVTKVHVSVGSQVSPGDPLATLGGTTANTALENASITLKQAQLSLQNAQDVLEHYTITAPISGTVIEKKFKQGDTIDSNSLTAAGGSLAILYDMSTLTFEMKIDEKDINKIQLGQEVSITSDAVEGATFLGIVDQIHINGTTVNGQTNYPIRVVIHDPQNLKPGMNVSADVIVDRAQQVMTIPVNAVRRGAAKPYVLVAPPESLDANGHLVDPQKLKRQEVVLGRNDNQYIEIIEGLTLDNRVFWENQQDVFLPNLSLNMVGG